MKCSIILSVCLLFSCTISFSQEWPLRSLVNHKKSLGVPFRQFVAFDYRSTKIATGRGVYQELLLHDGFKTQLLNDKPEAIKLSIPLDKNETINCELIKSDLGNFRFTKNRTETVENVKIPLCYRGIVTGEVNKNSVMLTINEDYLSLNLTFDNRTILIQNTDESQISGFRLYDSRKIAFPSFSFQCGTTKVPSEEALRAMNSSSSQNRTLLPQDKCVYVFVECFDSLYLWRESSYQKTVDYVYALFNNVATGYLNELINIKISAINVWTDTDPYRGDSRENALADLSAYYQDNFWGNICVGLDYSDPSNPRSGLAGDIGRVKGEVPDNCQAYTVNKHPFCYNDVQYVVNVQDFPTGPNVTQGAVYLVMHEVGHLLGSAHTQWCGWLIGINPNTFGALDNCSAPEGTCSPGPPPPASGGTIMSYCVGTGQFVSFNNGFGALPGGAIRNFVSGQSCISNCPICVSDVTVGDLPAGSSHFEVSNTITANGILSASAVATLDAGVKVTLSPGFKATSGSLMKIVIDGCSGIR